MSDSAETRAIKGIMAELDDVLPCTVEPSANCGGNHPNNCPAHYRYAVARRIQAMLAGRATTTTETAKGDET